MQTDLITRAEATQKTVEYFRNRPFNWGSADCVHVVAHCYRAMGGHDLLKGVRKYTTVRGALRAMRAAGCKDFAEYLDAKFERIAPALALPGDIIAVPGDHDVMTLALGVSVGQNLLFAYAPTGLASVAPIDVATHAWRVA